MDFICPNSPPVWDGSRLSACFENMVLGFGANSVTIVMIIVLGLKMKSSGGTWGSRSHFLAKVFLSFVPALGACACFCNILLLLNGKIQGHISHYHEWLLVCSQFLLWMIVVLFLKCDCSLLIFCNPILCIWWIIKVLFEVFHLWTVFSSLKAIRCFAESTSTSAEIMFGIYINLVKIMPTTFEKRSVDSLEECFFPRAEKLKEIHVEDERFGFLRYFHVLTFKVVNPMMNLGVKKQLGFEDLIELPSDLVPLFSFITLSRCWGDEQSKNHTSSSLFRAICCAYGWPYFCLGLLKAMNDAIGFVGPLLLNRLIGFLQQGSGHSYGYFLAISLGLSSIIKSFLDTQYSFNLMKLKLKLRAGIMTVVYHKCLKMSLAERAKFSDGEIQTFMSIDADRIINLCNSFHDMWSLPLQIGVALYLLYTQVKFAFTSGLAITVLLIPVNKWISTLIASATKKMMTQKDERIRSAAELLSHIRTVKMHSWEHLFAGWIMEKRALEVKHLATRKYLDAWCVFFWATTPTMFSLFTFGFFTLMGYSLDAATVFTCVALFNILISPLNSFPWVINGLIDAVISTRRLSRFLSCLEYNPPEDYDTNLQPTSGCSVESSSDTSSSQMSIIFQDANFAWASCEDRGKEAFLKQITLRLPKGFFVAVIGEVGSGKSSLLYSILREMWIVRGFVGSAGSLSYVPQIPWIMSGTVRDNILFGKEYDSRRYQEVIQACSLDVDISLMVGGDLAYIEEKGSNLSGGQRTRIALARALYQDSDLFLLDDVLSAVDAHVAYWILHKAILGPLMLQKTRVLCTHNIQAILAADMVILMDKGQVKWYGCAENFVSSPNSTISFQNVSNSMQSDEVDSGNVYPSGEVKLIHSSGRGDFVNLSKEAQKISDEVEISEAPETSGAQETPEVREISEQETRKEGKVEFYVCKTYAEFCSWPIFIVICVSAVLMQASRNGNDIWLSFWVDTTTGTQQSVQFYLVILCIFCIVNSLLTLLRAFSFSYGSLRATIEVHSKLMKNLVNAPVHFFDKNPSGRILNRLSSDLYMIDDSLPFILNILLANFFNLIGIAIVLCYAQVLLFLLLFPFGYIYKKLQFFYRSTSRELRRLDSVARSPIYSSFSETLNGSPTIRAFKAEEFFMSGFVNHVTLYQQTSYSESSTSLWLSLRLQLLAAVVISFIALLAVIGYRGNLPFRFGTPGLVGLALSYAAPIVSLLSCFLTSFTETEKEMVSVERVLQYMDIPQELQGSHPSHPAWPTEGKIEFNNVSLRYVPSFPAALNNVSFKIVAGTQVGIIGRTGAGKSSVLNALFRLAPICSGHILIDDVDIANVVVEDLRSRLAVVPQSPFLFEGSLRINLDPSGLANEQMIWNILEKCHVKEVVQAAGGLDIHVKEAGISFSVGQQQLICLARALIKSSKILCLDECTANVDAATTAILHNTISNECKGMTVLTIAHRISVIEDMDNVLILDHGILVEQGNPKALLKDDFSRFSGFLKASTM